MDQNPLNQICKTLSLVVTCTCAHTDWWQPSPPPPAGKIPAGLRPPRTALLMFPPAPCLRKSSVKLKSSLTPTMKCCCKCSQVSAPGISPYLSSSKSQYNTNLTVVRKWPITQLVTSSSSRCEQHKEAEARGEEWQLWRALAGDNEKRSLAARNEGSMFYEASNAWDCMHTGKGGRCSTVMRDTI